MLKVDGHKRFGISSHFQNIDVTVLKMFSEMFYVFMNENNNRILYCTKILCQNCFINNNVVRELIELLYLVLLNQYKSN